MGQFLGWVTTLFNLIYSLSAEIFSKPAIYLAEIYTQFNLAEAIAVQAKDIEYCQGYNPKKYH